MKSSVNNEQKKLASTASKKKKQTKKSGPTVEIVEWNDHWTSNHRWETELDHTPTVVKSAGIKVYEDKQVLQISTNVFENQHGPILTILKNCIVKRKTL